MNFPVYLRVGSVSLHPHWILETFAWTLAFWLYSRRRRIAGDVVDSRSRAWVVAAAAAPRPRAWVGPPAAIGGLIGSRLLYLLEDPARTAASWSDPSFLVGGKT